MRKKQKEHGLGRGIGGVTMIDLWDGGVHERSSDATMDRWMDDAKAK